MEFQKDIENCLHVLQAGGLILYPTDTIWGIGCDATDPDAVKKVFDCKQRQETKSLIVLLADERDLLKYVSQADLHIFDFLHKAKKPTTVIYEGAIGLAQNLVAEDGTIAIRIVKDPFCKHLIKRFRKPLVSTSANLSGEPAPRFFAEITRDIRLGVDYIVQYRQGDHAIKEPSAIIRWNKDGTHTVIRP
ncbi:MAG: L-threonylcarbamoyladenylate synthase [Puia sp.]|nr:L-threonylcarbamoyladenylate synthase [Puia sp.]